MRGAVLPGRNINVVMDNDDAGREATRKAIEQLIKAGAATIRVPLLPDLGPRQGLDDWLRSSHRSGIPGDRRSRPSRGTAP